MREERRDPQSWERLMGGVPPGANKACRWPCATVWLAVQGTGASRRAWSWRRPACVDLPGEKFHPVMESN